VEQETFTGPAYFGRYLDIIFDESKEWGSEEAFLAFTNTIFLEMGMKANLFHQLHSISKVRSHFYKKSLPKIATETKEKDGGRASILGPLFPSLPPQMYHKASPSKKSTNNSSTKQRKIATGNGQSIGSGALENMKDCSKNIQRQLGLKACDSKIIEYVVDLVHMQETEELSVNIPNTLKLDGEQTMQHQNKRKVKTK